MATSAGRSPGQVASRALPLGVFLGAHCALAVFALMDLPSRVLLAQWSLFAIALSSFHCLEFAWSATFEPATVTAEAFLLNHSRAYHVTLAAAVLEFTAGVFLFPEWKTRWSLTCAAFGLCLVVGGQVVRTLSMFTAGGNFTHLVAEQKRENHSLVRSGLYSVLRHPAYFGWFWWTIGMQLLLANPLSLVLWAAASWKFFYDRIPYEEAFLCDFFGVAYIEYAQSTVIGIPFIKPYDALVKFRSPAALVRTSSAQTPAPSQVASQALLARS